MNKKGQSVLEVTALSVYAILTIVVLTPMLFYFVSIFGGYADGLAEVPLEIEAEMLALRFTQSADCFAYEDNGRVFAGVIDRTKFTQSRMDACYKTEGETSFSDLNFGLELEGVGVLRTNNYFQKDELELRKVVYVKTSEGIERTVLRIAVQE